MNQTFDNGKWLSFGEKTCNVYTIDNVPIFQFEFGIYDSIKLEHGLKDFHEFAKLFSPFFFVGRWEESYGDKHQIVFVLCPRTAPIVAEKLARRVTQMDYGNGEMSLT